MMLGKNATLVCFGDSITEGSGAGCYVSLMQNFLTAGYPERNIRVVNAGVGGNRTPDLLARLDADVIALKPNAVLIMIGVNDVGWGFDEFNPRREFPAGDGPLGVPLGVYEANLNELADRLREGSDAELIFATPTVLSEAIDSPDSLRNVRLKTYVAAMRRVAEAKQSLIAPTHEDFTQAIRAGRSVNPDFRLTTDGVHMTPAGDARSRPDPTNDAGLWRTWRLTP